MKTFFTFIGLYLFTTTLGLLVGISFYTLDERFSSIKEIGFSLPYEKSDIANVAIIFSSMLFGAALFFFFIKLMKTNKVLSKHNKLFFYFFEAIIIFSASPVLILPILLFLNFQEIYSIIFSLIFAGFLSALRFVSHFIAFPFSHHLKNISAVISVVGIGAMIGYSLGFVPSLLIAILLSVYDYVAVFITKHMVLFANETVSKDLSLMISIGKKDLTKKSAKSKLKTKLKKPVDLKYMPNINLGTGDLVLPIILSVSSYPIFGFFGSISLIFGSLAGLLFLLYERKKQIVLPALPAICFGAIFSLLIFSLLY